MKLIHASVYLTLALSLMTMKSNAQSSNHKNNKLKQKTMSATLERNKSTVRKFYENYLNERQASLLNDLVSDDYTTATGERGAEAFAKPVSGLLKAFPDAQWRIVEIVAEEDKVMVQQQVQGTHKGQFQHIPPTQNKIVNDGAAIFTLKDGKIVQSTVQTDRLGFLQQLDILPTDLTKLSPKPAENAKETVNFIDKFFVPAGSKNPFLERMAINRKMIRTLPGFLGDHVYQFTDDAGNLHCVTIAVWESKEALANAKAAVQEEYKRQGFDMPEMMKRLNIVIERGVYSMTE